MPKHEFIKSTPEGLQYGVTDSPKPTQQTSFGWYEWQKSITWHDVKKEDEEAFRDLSYNYSGVKSRYKGKEFEAALSEGIEIPEGLVGLEKCKQASTVMCPVFYPYIIKPKVRETQDELWVQVDSIITENFINWEATLAELKQKFTIKRK